MQKGSLIRFYYFSGPLLFIMYKGESSNDRAGQEKIKEKYTNF